MSSMQSDFRRLMSELNENTHKVTVTNPNLDNIIANQLSPDQEKDGPYILDDNEWELFQQLANDYDRGTDWEKQEEPVDEMSTTSGAGAYLPGLNVPAKKYKYGYKEVKGFRAGHTKDTGGFQYKDLWNLNEDQFNELILRQDKDKVEKLLAYIKDKAPNLYNKFLVWMSEPYPHDYEEFVAAAGVNEAEEAQEEEFKIGDKVEILGKFPDKSYGKVISFDDDLVAVNVTKGGGSTYERRMMIPHGQLKLQSSEIKKKEKKEKAKEMEKEPIKEGLKTEIKVRNKKQQFQEATKLANKKLKEINSILEYACNLKSDLNETEYSLSSKAMESMKKSIAEAYKKMKSL